MTLNKIISSRMKTLIVAILLASFATIAVAYRGVNMRTYIQGGAGVAKTDMQFIAYYGGDDNIIQTEDSYNNTNDNDGYYTALGLCRVNSDQDPAATDGSSYDIWVTRLSSSTAGHATGTVTGTDPTYTTPGTSGSRLSLAAPNFLSTPGGAIARAGNGSVFVAWNAVAGATGYTVYRNPVAGNGNFVYERVGTTSNTYLIDSHATNGTVYQYIIVARDATRRSGHTNGISVTPTAATVPTVTGPASGARGASITITGSNFAAANTVYINGLVQSAAWNGVAPITINAATPLGAGSLVIVRNDNNRMGSTAFTVNAAEGAGTLQFSLANYPIAENVAGGRVTVTVTRTGGSAGAVGVHYATSNGTATAGADYTATSDDLAWAAGDADSKTFTVTITDDVVDEVNETINLTLSAATGGAALGARRTATVTINDNDDPVDVLNITTAALPPGTVGVPYNQTVLATGGAAPYTWSIAAGSSLPDGLNIAAATGVISGTPTVARDFTFTVGVEDSSGSKDSQSLTISIAPVDTPTITGVREQTTGNLWANVYNNIIITGRNFGDDPLDGNRDTAANHVTINGLTINDIVDTGGDDGIQVYSWSDNEIRAGVPRDVGGTYIVAGNNPIIVTAGSDASAPFETLEIRPLIYGIDPVTVTAGTPLTINGTAFGANPDHISVSFNGTAAVPSAANNTTVTVTPPAGVASGNLVVTVNGIASNARAYTVSGVVDPDAPTISGLAPTSAYAGQTIVISGSNFGAARGASTVTIGGRAAIPAAWSANSITVTVPSGLVAGPANTIVTVGGAASAPRALTIIAGGAIIDDFEGGAVSNWVVNIASGYYAFEDSDDITPNSDNISADLRTAAAASHGALGAQVRYSFVGTDATAWGGGWGAKLNNTIDLSSYSEIHFYIRWDGSSNNLSLSLVDRDGTSCIATISNSVLSATSGSFGRITRNRLNDFDYDPTGSAVGSNADFDWTQVVGYNFIYNTNGTSVVYHSIDSIYAGVVDLGEEEPPVVVDSEVMIQALNPASAPAGTRFTINGQGFGGSQGQSVVNFQNIDNRTSYTVSIVSWSDTSIEAIVPNLAPRGSYDVRVTKISVASGLLQAFESNTESFSVTNNVAGNGIATVFPNPFNPLATALIDGRAVNQTNISFDAGEAANIGVYIYDAGAKLVYQTNITTNTLIWNGRDTGGSIVADGLYLIRIVNEDTKKLIAKAKILVVKR